MNRQVDVKALVSHIVRGDGSDKCRICLGDTSEGQVYLEDTVMMEGDKPVTLAELLEIITGVEILEDPLLPPGVCVTCTYAVTAAQEFKTLVRTSHTTWQKAVKVLEQIDSSSTAPLKSVCVFLKKDTLSIQTVKDYAGGDPKTVLHRLTTKLTRKQHSAEKKPRAARSGPSSTCPDCNQHFSSPFYLNTHLKNSGHKEACLICGNVVIRGQDMKDHLAIVHGEIVISCTECPILFGRESDLKKHLKTAHKSGTLTCGDCGRTFQRSSAFEAHSQMHAVRTCRSCLAQFTNRSCYRRHRSQCEPDAKPDAQDVPRNRRSNIRDPSTFICDYCGKTYHSRPQLKNHILWIHLDIRPYKCDWCEKRFYTPARLTEHKVVHTRERNFECDLCGAKLVSKMAAVYHRRRHTGERPYECDICGEKFISASRRSEHAKRRHNKGFRFQCAQCTATFVRGHELRKHVEKAHRVVQIENWVQKDSLSPIVVSTTPDGYKFPNM